MNKKLSVLILTGTLACTMALPALAVEQMPTAAPTTTAEETQTLPGSVLYYGTVQEIVKDENGNITRLRMNSERYGEYIMNITEQTVWIDSGRCIASDPSTLTEGEGIYVFHSAAAALSLPPQSIALAVVRDIPADAGTAQFHEVEAVSLENGQLKITTNNGSLSILADQDTALSRYGSDEAVALEDIQSGSQVMAWYGSASSGQASAYHLMLLPGEADETLTRGELVAILHERAGKPVVDFAMDYTDVAGDSEYAEAIRWATSEQLVSGYGNGTFGPEDTVTREQLVTILWRYEGSPMLMDYPGLSQCADVGEISRFAQPAFAWAHQQGLIAADEDGLLHPQADATRELAETMLEQLSAE